LKKIVTRLLLSAASLLSLASAQTSKIISEEISIPGSEQKIKLVSIKGGCFSIGSNSSSKADEKPAKTIAVSDFWMGAFEITHDQFDIFFKDENTSQGSKVDAVTRPTPQYIDLSWNMGKDGGYPANSMSVDAAMMFCRWLYQKTGIFFRLPTEAEWEYACRAGSKTSYFFGDNVALLGQYAWYKANSGEKYHKVGQKKPNQWGLYDMLGNVVEWTMDQYDPAYYQGLAEGQKDPTNPPVSRYPRSLRGGSYLDDATHLKVYSRAHSVAQWNQRDPQIPKSRWWLTDGMMAGFRIVKPVQQPNAEDAEKFYKLYLGN
jgi:formylglycine-generating enzyme required for sulfatase activity